jgi:hypothetical protein
MYFLQAFVCADFRLDLLMSRSRAVAVVRAAVAVILAGCSTHSGPISWAAPDALESILLTAQEANTALGASGMEVIGPINHTTFTKNLPTSVSNPDCLSTANVALDPVYAGSGYTAIVEERLADSGPDFQPSHVLAQAVASFPSADPALAFVKNLAAKWKACAGLTITVETITTAGGLYSEQQYATGEVTGDIPDVALTKTGGKQDCQRALRALSNVVIDVEACGSPLNDQGRQIADQMAAKATG